MSFFKSLVRRVKRTVKAQVTSQVTGFVGRTAQGAVSRATGGLSNRLTSLGVQARRAGNNPLANIKASSIAKGAIARAKSEKIVDPFKL
jgi:hypothetical protein